jgi:hypothetical protein
VRELITATTKGLRPLSHDITGKVVVIKYSILNKRYQSPRFQIIKATGGFGCKEGSTGKVFGRMVADGSDITLRRDELLGEASDELVMEAMADDTPVKPIEVSKREFLIVAKDGNQTRGTTQQEAYDRLRRITRSAVLACYHIHPESTINELGYMSYPEGIPPVEMSVRKGKDWTAAK